ncbi:hypothetical protein PQU96_09835 [Vogesella sp. LYT5W]|uniref:Uncharacterized protein n=1 Tax=Vogesella margarita TaxID=2984199 RepID=A0ABT5IPF6_9NEIS|nr:hypothetical protein [Vogesella margarita]MDC7714427.1 hypothetical protein [Vogesella margarita]
MGEAKRRGSAEQRMAQATSERPLAEVLAELGLPTDTRFKGYVLHSEENDDFVAHIDRTTTRTFRAYCATPEDALTFRTLAEALKELKEAGKPLVVGRVFDTGTHLMVGFIDY